MENGLKHLYRSRNNRIIAGVAGGMGEYFEVDPILIRLVFVILTIISGGLGVLFYLILALIIHCCPTESKESTEEPLKKSAEEIRKNAQSLASELKNSRGKFEEKRNIIGTIFIILGIFALLGQLLPDWFNWNLFWPIIIILVGLYIISKSGKR